MGCKGMAEMRGGDALSRATESCQGVAEMRGGGGTVARCSKVEKKWQKLEKGEERLRVFVGCRKVAEMRRRGVVASCRGLLEYGRDVGDFME